jgi:kynurenine formamidase
MQKSFERILPLLLGGAALIACGKNEMADLMQRPKEIIDLSHTLEPTIPHWPAENYMPLRLDTIATIERDGVFSMTYHIPEHYGTHVDAPNHFVAGQIPVDEILPQNLLGPMVVIDIVKAASEDPDYVLETADLTRWENIYGAIPDGALVFLNTGWGKRWDDPEAYRNMDESGVMHFPAYGQSAARFLVDQRHVKAIGIDNLSIDPGISKDFAVHKIVNGAGVYALENVANLDKAPARGAFAVVAPIKLKGGTGGQARIFAIVS